LQARKFIVSEVESQGYMDGIFQMSKVTGRRKRAWEKPDKTPGKSPLKTDIPGTM